ncbi:asparagine synthase (glutamine-hydrolyzing) [Candidatus Pelagibacter sp.]|nr:asparagine synthase (glutamine-hydrolyzing) [Candidatus Pelagibacter sp.]
MCGFFAQIPFKNYQTFNKKKFIESSKLISHRGPDEEKYFFSKKVNLSFYRLSIIDQSLKASQPMVSFSKNLIIVFNGEIYNANELKVKLKGYSFKSNSDTEILLNLYHKYGANCLKYLEGMFSFLIYNNDDNSCFISRDRFGVKPLYFKIDGSQFLISSEIKPILNYSNENRFNKKAFKDFLIKQKMDHKEVTFFKDIKSLEKSHYAIIKNKNLLKFKYWSIIKGEHSKCENFEKKYLELFNKSIDNHLISDRKIGLLFSGGTDSTALAIIMKKKYERNFTNYTYDFEKNKIGDGFISNKISRKLNINNKLVLIKPNEIISDFDNMCLRLESPFTSIRLFGHHKCLKEMKKDSVAVVLEGSGGDEILGGYEYNIINSYLDQIKNKSDINKFINYLLQRNKKKFYNYIETIRDQFNVLKNCHPFLNKKYFKNNFLSLTISDELIFKKNLNKTNFLQKSQLKDIDYVNLPRSLKYSDRLSMSCGIENRVPFLDTNLSSFCFNLENRHKIRNGIERFISKKSTTKIVKQNFFLKEKKAITDPQTLWLKTHLKEYVLDNLHTREFNEYEILNSKKFINCFQDFEKQKDASSFDIFMNFTAFMFYKNFKQKFRSSF